MGPGGVSSSHPSSPAVRPLHPVGSGRTGGSSKGSSLGDAHDSLGSKSRSRRPVTKDQRFNERAPPPNMFLVQRNELDEENSDADSVVSDYQEEKSAESAGSAPGTPSFAAVCASMPGSSDLLRQSLGCKAGLRPTSAKKEDALPSLRSQPVGPKSFLAESGRGAGSIPGVNAWTSRAGGSQIPVTASSAGEWVAKLKALEEILTVHKQIAYSVLEFVMENIPEATMLDAPAQKKLLDRMNHDLGASREMLAQNAQGLIGSDLAELRLVQAERKKINDKITRMNALFVKDSAALRERIKASTDVQALPNRKDEFEPFLFTSPEQRSYLVAVLDRMMKAIIETQPDMVSKVNGSEMARLQDLVSRERMATLEKQVAFLTEQHAEAVRTMARLETQKEQLEQELKNATIQRSPSSSSHSSDWMTHQETNTTPVIQRPAGKPKSGRPKRNSAAGSGASSNSGEASREARDDSSNDYQR